MNLHSQVREGHSLSGNGNWIDLRRVTKTFETAVWRGHTVGIVFQFFQLLPALTAIEVALCVGVSLYAPNLVKLIKRMHGG